MQYTILRYTFKESKLIKILRIAQKGTQQLRREIDDKTVHLAIKAPAMYLAGYHKIYAAGLHIKLLKIYGMLATTLCK